MVVARGMDLGKTFEEEYALTLKKAYAREKAAYSSIGNLESIAEFEVTDPDFCEPSDLPPPAWERLISYDKLQTLNREDSKLNTHRDSSNVSMASTACTETTSQCVATTTSKGFKKMPRMGAWVEEDWDKLLAEVFSTEGGYSDSDSEDELW